MQAARAPEQSVRLAIRSARRLFRDALATCLAAEREFSVVGHVPDEADLLALCALRAPDLVLFDIGGAVGPKPLASLAALHRRCPRTRLLVVYDELSRAELTAIWQVGVDAILPGSHSLDALMVVLHQHAAALRSESGPVRPDTGLTDQEQEIIALIAGGHTVSRIAELLGTSSGAVANRKRQIYRKLLVSSQSHAIARATALGLVNRSPNRRARIRSRGGAMLVVLRGPMTATLRQVMAVLAANRIDVVVEDGVRYRGRVAGQDGPPTCRPVLVLVDPAPSDWPGVDEVTAPALLVRSEPMSPAETIAALGCGVSGVVAAEDVVQTLVPALVLTDLGHVTVEPGAADALLAGIGSRFFDVQHGLPELTARESEILSSIASGHTVRQTARRLGIAEKTVQNIQARMFRKLGTQNRAGALSAAHALGLL
ncbi:LuxR C-terminal-related transcriptional regulator [Plantactinospora solaniradicis]|uniref:LuxR C-terminal-related transcriptional regulator n=1 Tax=Plantactinospora solaniradicis TaxID=1723736 RepID=A0ABW1KHB2_9ACTN